LLDFHNHLIPGVDDGAADEEQSAAALQALSDQGIDTIITTPHINGSLSLQPPALAERLREIDAGWARLVAVVASRFPRLKLYRGAEVMLDTPQPDLSDARLRLAGGAFALVEFPFMTVPPQSTSVLRHLSTHGIVPVLAHPERYSGLPRAGDLTAEWKSAGALLQVNAGSLTGRYGADARASAFALLERGLCDYICSDFHARGRPSTAGARRILAELGAAEVADLLTIVNPQRLLDGAPPLPVAPLRRQRNIMGRLREWLK
jgi:protein-tyrosine phosphatase